MKKAKVLENLMKLLARLEREDISTPEEDRALDKVVRKMVKQQEKERELETCKEEIRRLRPLKFRPALELALEGLKNILRPRTSRIHTR